MQEKIKDDQQYRDLIDQSGQVELCYTIQINFDDNYYVVTETPRTTLTRKIRYSTSLW